MKTSFKILILFIVLAIGFFLVQNLIDLSKIGQPQIKLKEGPEVQLEISVSLRLDFGNGNIKIYDNIKLGEEKTVFDLLKKVTEENNSEFSFKEYPDIGVFIESIDNVGKESETNKWWQYWVNNEYAQVEAGSFLLKDGDTVEWKYVESQF